MKVKSYIYGIILLLTSAAISSCKKDNYDAPKSILSGKVVYNGIAVGVRSNGPQLQLWQHGYDDFEPIAVNIDQDGSYSARLFDGDYKLVRIGGGPWISQTDSIDVHVKGNTVVDVPVTPYFAVSNVTYTKSGNSINASVTVVQGDAGSQIEQVRLYVFKTTILDQNHNNGIGVVAGSAVTPGTAFNASVAIPSALANAGSVYVRVGVKTVGANELAYSAPQKIDL